MSYFTIFDKSSKFNIFRFRVCAKFLLSILTSNLF